jgi:hypothetical protein
MAPSYSLRKAPRLSIPSVERKPLPEATNAVAIEHHFITHDGHVFSLRLSYEHAIKGILVSAGKQARANSVFPGDRQHFKSFSLKVPAEIRRKIGASA